MIATILLQVSPLLGQNFEWVFQHIAIIGYPTICVVGWKIMKFLSKAEIQINKTLGQIDKMSSNCFPTMQKSLLNQDELLHSMDASLRQIANQTSKIRTPRKK